ncbi:MAG TPA: metallophosphoesterase [Polyangia bacterium]|nr:metallophosphoesterase [Polyangia bacterium]
MRSAGFIPLLLAGAVAATPARADQAPAAPKPAGSVPAPGADAKAVPVTVGGWRFFSGPPPAGWANPAFDDKSWGGPAAGPFVPDRAGLSDGATPTIRYSMTRGQPLLLRGHVMAADPSRVRVLDLRVAYGDGFIAYLDGREVARRGMAPSGTAAVFPHGPEVERVSVEVPPGGLPAAGSTVGLAIFAAPMRNMVVPLVPAAAVEIGAASGVRIVRGPYLNARADDAEGAGITIRWQTDRPASGKVTVARADGVGAPRVLDVPRPALAGTVTVGGLHHGRAYTYRVDLDAGDGDRAAAGPFEFQTMPAAPATVRFAVYGDMRYPGHAAHRMVVEGLVREAPPMVFNTGDLTDLGSEESNWQKYFEITAPLGAITPVVPALGNHDGERRGLGAAIAWELFGIPARNGATPPPGWTSLDYGGVHFVILSTNEMGNMAQRDWLKADLARARENHARAIFAFCHEGPWSHGIHGNSDLMGRVYAPLLAAAHADVLFSGHDHIYERGVGSTPSGKLNYVVTGGGGAPLYPTSCRAASGPPLVDTRATRPCPSSVLALTQTYHYIMVEVAKSGITMCPRHPDGTPVEPCIHLPPH